MESDALTIARWYEPDRSSFGESFDEIVAQHEAKSWGYVRLWERAMVERGLGDEYGRALCAQMALPVDSLAHVKFQVAWVAHIRTAPLDAIVRALASVARRHQTEESK